MNFNEIHHFQHFDFCCDICLLYKLMCLGGKKNMLQMFTEACYIGNLDTVMKLIETQSVTPELLRIGIYKACEANHILIVRFLLSINVVYEYAKLFRLCCKSNYTQICELLMLFFPRSRAFKILISCNQIEFLNEVVVTHNFVNIFSLFKYACKIGNRVIAETYKPKNVSVFQEQKVQKYIKKNEWVDFFETNSSTVTKSIDVCSLSCNPNAIYLRKQIEDKFNEEKMNACVRCPGWKYSWKNENWYQPYVSKMMNIPFIETLNLNFKQASDVFEWACEQHVVEIVTYLLEKYPSLCDEHDSIRYLCSSSFATTIIAKILSLHPKQSTKSDIFITACENNLINVVKELIDFYCFYGFTVAIKTRNSELVNYLSSFALQKNVNDKELRESIQLLRAYDFIELANIFSEKYQKMLTHIYVAV